MDLSNIVIKLNLGCGSNKIDGFVNIDTEESCKPDLIHNFATEPLPYGDATVDQIVMFHTIEHIPKYKHAGILAECFRVLKYGAPLWISYPEFTACVENWKNNFMGKKDFWEATIFGRQLYPSDYHVALMHTPDFKVVLEDAGFENIVAITEPIPEIHNTVIKCTRRRLSPVTYEQYVAHDRVLHERPVFV